QRLPAPDRLRSQGRSLAKEREVALGRGAGLNGMAPYRTCATLAPKRRSTAASRSSLGATLVAFSAILVSAEPGTTMQSEAEQDPGNLPRRLLSSASLSDVACSADSFSSMRVALAARTSASRETSSTLISGDG